MIFWTFGEIYLLFSWKAILFRKLLKGFFGFFTIGSVTVSRTWFKWKYLPISWSGIFGICLSCLYTHILIGSPLGLVDLFFPPGKWLVFWRKSVGKMGQKTYFYLIKSVIEKIFGNGKDIGLPYIKAFHWGKYFFEWNLKSFRVWNYFNCCLTLLLGQI